MDTVGVAGTTLSSSGVGGSGGVAGGRAGRGMGGKASGGTAGKGSAAAGDTSVGEAGAAGDTTGGRGGLGGGGPIVAGKIAGFGVNGQPRNWGTDGTTVKAALDLLVNDLGANLFRVEINRGESDWEAKNDDSDPMNFDWDVYDPIFESKDFTDLWDYIRYLNSLGVTDIELAAHGLLPDWMGGNSITSGKEDEFVETMLAVLLYARDRAPEPKPQFSLFSPWNETNYGPPEGFSLQPRDGVPILRKLVDRMSQFPELDDLQLVTPETAGEDDSVTWRGALLGDAVVSKRLQAIGFHRYSGHDVGHDWHGVTPPQWMTEFNDLAGFCYTTSWDDGMQLAGNLFAALEAGAEAGMVWSDYDAPHAHQNDEWQSFGLLAGSYQGSSDLCTKFMNPPSQSQLDAITYAPKPTYYAAQHFFAYVERGADVVPVSDDQNQLRMLGFRNPDGTVAIVGQNEGFDGTWTIHIDGDNPGAMGLWLSKENSYDKAGSTVTFKNGSASVMVPGYSMFSLLSK